MGTSANPVSAVDMATYDDDENEENKLINEGMRWHRFHSVPVEWKATHNIVEYKTWKKNSPFLYDMILR